jgi:ABC-type uncharacterized transport system substrate-binding protein
VKRRQFITLLGGAALAWPFAARAQETKQVRRIGVLTGDAEDDPGVKARLAAFRQGLDRLGWSLDRNVRIDYRFAANNPDQYQSLAKELVRLQPDVLLAYTTPVAAALERESRTIPIVFVNVSDPIGSGLVASLARPGGNLTGLLLYEEGITGKWLAMLKEIAPGLSRAALIANPKRTPYDSSPLVACSIGSARKSGMKSDRARGLRPIAGDVWHRNRRHPDQHTLFVRNSAKSSPSPRSCTDPASATICRQL